MNLRGIWLVVPGLLLLLVGALVLRGGEPCDPEAHLFVQNHYPFAVFAHHLANPARNMPDQPLGCLFPGQRTELAHNVGLDGDLDHIVIEDGRGRRLETLSEKGPNVICKRTTPDYLWEIAVGPTHAPMNPIPVPRSHPQPSPKRSGEN